MKKEFRSKIRGFKIVSTTVIIGALLVAGCNGNANLSGSNATDLIESSDTNISQTDELQAETQTIITIETTVSLDDYKFPWEDDENYEFDIFVQGKYGIYLAEYVSWFGFTDELNVDFTNFVNSRFNKDYESVPFKKANYFHKYISIAEVKDFYSEYEYFRLTFLNVEKSSRRSFDSKLVMSYLAQNNIPFGNMVPIEYMRALVGDDVYTCDLSREYFSDIEFGNYVDSYIYSNEELVTAIKDYNSDIASLAIDIGIKTLDLEGHFDECDTWNDHLIKYFGADAPRFGQCLTKEQVIKLTGGYYDLSYIPGAVIP